MFPSNNPNIGRGISFERSIINWQYTIINIYFLNLLTLIKYFFGLGKEYQDVKSSIDRINEIFSIPLENNGTVCLEKIKEIDIKNFCIRNLFCFNEKLEVNNMYVVTGENGIGKTTFLKGMLGLFNEYTGMFIIQMKI